MLRAHLLGAGRDRLDVLAHLLGRGRHDVGLRRGLFGVGAHLLADVGELFRGAGQRFGVVRDLVPMLPLRFRRNCFSAAPTCPTASVPLTVTSCRRSPSAAALTTVRIFVDLLGAARRLVFSLVPPPRARRSCDPLIEAIVALSAADIRPISSRLFTGSCCSRSPFATASRTTMISRLGS